MTAESYSVQRWTVAANSVLLIDAVGTFIACLESTLTDFEIAIDSGSSQFMAQGLTVALVEGEQFKQFTIDNSDNGSALTVRLAWGTGRLRDARLSLTGALNISKASVLDTVADVSVAATSTVEILAANTNRREALISNLSGAVTARIGDSNAGATRGVELLPGQQMVLDTTEAIFAYNPSGGAITFGLVWTED